MKHLTVVLRREIPLDLDPGEGRLTVLALGLAERLGQLVELADEGYGVAV